MLFMFGFLLAGRTRCPSPCRRRCREHSRRAARAALYGGCALRQLAAGWLAVPVGDSSRRSAELEESLRGVRVSALRTSVNLT